MLSKSEIQTFLEKVHSSPLDGREVCWVALGQSWFTISELRLVGRVCWSTNKIHQQTALSGRDMQQGVLDLLENQLGNWLARAEILQEMEENNVGKVSWGSSYICNQGHLSSTGATTHNELCART